MKTNQGTPQKKKFARVQNKPKRSVWSLNSNYILSLKLMGFWRQKWWEFVVKMVGFVAKKCGKLSWWDFVVVGLCPSGISSWWDYVRVGNCRVGFCRSGKLLGGKLSSGKLSVNGPNYII